MMLRAPAFLVLAFAVAACGGGGAAGPTGTSGTTAEAPGTTGPGTAGTGLASADELCALLNADDWGQLNYVTAAQPSIESDGPGSAYCVYAGESGASGGLELDAFAHQAEAAAEETFDTIAGAMDDGQDAALPGADESLIQTEIVAGDDDPFGAIVVRSGRFTFSISGPAGEDAEAQLPVLAETVLQRSQSLH
jgi:hypothetical protein